MKDKKEILKRLRDYLDNLFKDKPKIINASPIMLASMCRSLNLTPDELIRGIRFYCKNNNIQLEQEEK
jgi:hypothetical protein